MWEVHVLKAFVTKCIRTGAHCLLCIFVKEDKTAAISSSTLLIGYYHGLLLKYMDANFLIEKMRSTNLLTTSKEEMILTGHSAHQRSRLLLEHVQQMGTKDLLVFCDFVEQNIPEVGSQLIKALQFIDTTGAHSCTHQEVEIINASSLHIMFLKVIDQIEEQLQLHDSSLLIEKCKSLMASETHKISLFSKKFIDTLGKCDDAFKYLSFLFTWSNHSILRALTSSNIEAIDLLDRFDSLLDCSKHILSYPIPSFSQNMLPFDTSEYTLLAVKFEKELWECPLQYVLDIESFIIKAYDLTQYCLQLLAVKCDGPTAFYWTIPKCIQELISQHPEYLQQGTLELEVYSKATDSDIIKGSDDRIAEGSNGSIAKQSSAFTTSKPTVDDSSRASEHEQKSVLQVDLLKNFNLFTSKHSKAPRICLFLVSPKKRSKDKKVIDFHYFVRICVPELNKKATPELFEMQFKEGLHQLELAFYDRRSPSTYNNHIFLNFCVVLTMDPKQMQAKISHLVSLCKLKLAELRVTEIEIKASIKFAYEERCMRIFISPSGNTDLYFEVENRTTGEVIFQTCGPQKGPYDGLNVDWPYFRPKKSETMIPNSEYEALKQEKKHLADELSCANSKVLQQESEIKLQNSQIETLRKERQQAFSKYCDQIFLKQKIMNLINELESVKAKNKHLTDKYSMAVSDSKLKRYNRQYSDNQLEALKNEIKPPNSEVMVELIALNKEKKQIIDEQIKQSSLIDELESEIMMLKYKLEASRKEYKQLIVKYNTLKSERNKTSVAIQTDEIQFQVSGLPQDDAVKVLENNSLHMNKFIYKYLWEKLEGEDIRKKNEIIEEMITQELHNDYNLQQSLMVQYKLPTVANCNVLVYLLRECKLPLEICLDVAKMNDDIQKAESLLTQECLICCDLYLINKMVKMINCDHAVCHNCFVGYFSVMITEKSIKHYNCPLCGEPDITSEAIHFDFYLQLFGELMQKHMKKEQYEMSVQKINEHKMMKDPNFRWCTKCSTGFINEAGTKKIQCPNPTCGETMCFFCKKPWEEQHINLTCEDFAAWKKDNDPKLQEQGLAAYLNERGIECPSCGFKYAVVGGGHMHFRCAHCPAEFCIGCNNLFRKAKHCIEYESCYKKGIHAHHPRDCLFFLRDESVENLQKLLQVNNVEFDTESPEEQNIKEIALWGPQTSVAPLAAAGAAPTPVMKCNVMLQKENPNGPPVDEKCSFAVQSGHAGLCLKHYKVYLVFKINQNHIDPLPLFKISQLKGILDRDEVKVPNQLPGEGEPEYTERLRQIIKKKIPLVEGKGNHC